MILLLITAFGLWYYVEVIKPVDNEQAQGRQAQEPRSESLFDTVDPWDSTEAQGLDDFYNAYQSHPIQNP